MKRKILPLLCTWLAIFHFGCQGSHVRRAAPTDEPDTTMQDSAKSSRPAFRTQSYDYNTSSSHGTCDIHIDYPVSGPEAVVSSVREFIKSTLFDDGGLTHDDNPQTLMHDYCNERQKLLEKTLEQMGIQQVNEDNAPEEGIDIRLISVMPQFVTYEIYRYSYITHGAHGEYSDYGVTFRLSDGHRFSDDIISHVDEKLFAHIREGMKHYFGVHTDKELEALCTADLSLMPMPTFPPYLVRDGVRFHYSIYDICPFEQGDPMVTIPYEVALPYLTPSARELVPQ